MVNIFLAIGVIVDILVLALYQSISTSANQTFEISLGNAWPIICGIFCFILILQIVALILVNLKKGEIVRTVGGYVAIVAAIIDITFFLVSYLGFVNLIVAVGILIFAILLIKTINN
jgi:signal transduction histidine kinase